MVRIDVVDRFVPDGMRRRCRRTICRNRKLELPRHFGIGGRAPEQPFEHAFRLAEFAAALDRAPHKRRAFAQLVDHRTPDADRRIGRKSGRAAILERARSLDQRDHADLYEVLDIDRGRNPRMHMPRDLAHQPEMAFHQRFGIGGGTADRGVHRSTGKTRVHH